MPITLEEIKQIIDNHTSKDNRTLRLPVGAIPSVQIDALYRDYLLNADLVVLQAQSVLIPNVNVTVVGSGSSFPFAATTITAVFTVREGEAALVLTATGIFDQTTKWDFAQAFPALASTYYKRLKFTTAALILRSYDVSLKQPKGLHFTGEMELTGKLGWITVFLNGANPVGLAGAITLRTADLLVPANAIPVMALRPPEASEVLIGTFNLSVIFEVADTAFVLDNGMIVPVPEMQLVSAISVDTASDEEAFKISTRFTDNVGILTFQANDIGEGVEVGMQALSKLANGTNLQRVLPSQLPVISYFAFKNWSLTVDPRNMSLKSVTLGVETARPWEVIPGLLTLELLKFQFVISNLTGKFETNAELNADLGIGEGEAKFIINLDAFYPSYIMAGSLESETPIDLKVITRKFLGDAIADTLPDTLKVTVLSLMLDPKSSAFTFQTVITTDWMISIGIANFGLTTLGLDINYLAGASQGTITASVLIGPPAKEYMVNVSAFFDSEADGWLFSAELSSETPISLKDLIDAYLPPEYQLFEPPDVTIKALGFSFDTGVTATYTFNISVEWLLNFGEGIDFTIGAVADIESFLTEAPEGMALKRVYKGFIRGILDYNGIRLEVELQFDQQSTAYVVRFEGFEGILKTIIVEGKEQRELTVTLPKGKTVGGLITTLIHAVLPGSDITLGAPWSVLNSLSLDSFAFKVNFTTGKVGFTYEPNLNLGFASIDKLELSYDTQNSTVMFSILKGRFLDKQIPEQQQVAWNVLNPGETQQVPGQGTKLFDLQFLGVGQHVAIKGLPSPNSVLEAVNQMEGAFHEAPGLPASSLTFDEHINWLIGTRFTVIEAFNIGIVFNDPELYGLVINVNGAKALEKARIFKGLRFEILYKKVSETVGVYQIDFQLPDVIRQLEFGAVSVTLPNLKLFIYTNGDFKVDLGFPENEDFARSFSIQAWPFLGSGGLYFGKLSGETAPNLPRLPSPPLGNFNPVIVFGIGLRLGLGKSIEKGILKAGFSLTAQGILEGTIAFYNPYDPNAPDYVQDAKYYFIQGKLVIVGRIYGEINFAIISAKLDITVFISVRVVMEAYEAMLISFSAGISVSLEVKINLGIFSITINLSFKATIEQSFTIGQSDPYKPWNWPSLETEARRPQYFQALDTNDPCPGVLIPLMKWQPVIKAERQDVLLYFAPQFTAATDGPLGEGAPRTVKCVAMTYVRSRPLGEAAEPTPFDHLAWATLVWTLNALINVDKSDTTYEEIINQEVTRKQLQAIYCYLSQEGLLEPFTYEDVLGFLSNYFNFKVTLPPSSEDAEEQVSVFPVLPLLTLKTSTDVEHDFSVETPSSTDYLLSIKRYFNQLAARYKSSPPEAGEEEAPPIQPLDADPSLATFIFVDFFALLAKSTIQAAMDLMDSVEVDPGDSSLSAIVSDNPKFNISVSELAFVNRLRRLNPNVELKIEGATYIAKQEDSLASVAARFHCDPEELRRLNPYLDDKPLEPTTKINLGRFNHTTSANSEESLLSVAGAHRISVEALATINQDVAGLFAPGQKLVVPFVEQMTVGALAEGLQDNGSFGNLSGLSARVLLQGLRPPSPPESKYQGVPTPLYQLTGQQFDAADLEASDTISLNLAEALPWFKLENPADDGLSIEFTLTESDMQFLDDLRQAPFSPDQQFEQIELFRIEPKKFTLPSFINWQTPVVVSMVNAQAERQQQDEIEPTLWKFSSDLQQLVTVEKAVEPRMELLRQVQEDASHLTDPIPVDNFSWATFFTVTVRQTPTPGASGEVLPDVYELQGLEGGAGLLLQNLLTYYGEQGTPIIDEIQILYPMNPAVEGQQEPPVGLKSDASPTVFLLQTNLSTISNPPQLSSSARDAVSAASQSNLVGMTDIEFIKLLWEAGVVLSGGYYLYYEAEGKGLPDYLFNEDGIASLTILVTYTITDSIVRSFLNSVVVRESIDVRHEILFLQADLLQVEDAALAPGESLESFALRHQISINKLVSQYENRHARLTPGADLRIPPRTHRIRSGETLQQIAAAHGAEEAAIASLNAGQNLSRLSERSFLKLPATIHRSAEDDTLDSLSQRFGISLIALAHANKLVPNLFQDELSFDHRLEDKISNIPPGNVGFRLKRTNADGPAKSEDESLTGEQKQLEQLYNLLEYRIVEQGVFKKSDPALPVGPAIEEENPSLNLKTSPLPAPQEVEYWIYEGIVPVYPFVKHEEDDEPASNLPDPDQDPYAGVGETAVVKFNWQDLFGNWLDISAGAISDWPDKGFWIGYTDPVIALDQWPSVTVGYQVEDEGGPTLLLLLRFYPEKYLNGEESAGNEIALQDLELYKRVYYQLTQPDAEASVTTSLGEISPKNPEQKSPKEMLIEFVEKICQFLTEVVKGITPTPDPIDQMMPFTVSDSNPKNIFELLVSVEIKRNPDLVADEFKDVAAVTAVSSVAPPNLKTEAAAMALAEPLPPPLSLQEFAQKIQDAFPTLKVLTGIPQSGLGEKVRDIWIARFTGSETGIEFAIDTASPLYYAIEPLAVTLLAEPDVLIYPYRQSTFIGDETGVPKSFSGVDIELLATNFLAAVDRILQADYAVPLWLLENQSPPAADEPVEFPFQAIIEAKKKLAKAISDHVTNVFEGEVGDQENLRSAREALRQELLIELSNAYTVDTIVEFNVEVEHSEFGADYPNPPLLFGMPVAHSQFETTTADASAYSFSTARMSLSNVEDASKLTFLFETRNKRPEDTSVETGEPYFEIDLDYRVNAIEEPAAQEVPGIKDYRPSTWLMFVLPFTAQALGEMKLPIPLRAYPTSPSLTEQTFTAKLPQFVEVTGLLSMTPDDELKDARRWNYKFTYEYVGATQDTIHLNVKINTPFDTGLTATARGEDEPTLLEALLQFSQAYPGIAADLDNYLVKGVDPQIAMNAARSFAWLADRAARAWGNWDTDLNMRMKLRQESPEFEFQILERPLDHEGARILKVTVTAQTEGMALPIFRIPGYETEPAVPPDDAQEVSYLFYRDVEGAKEYLSYQDAKTINRRELTFRDFDVMDIENAWAGAFVVRNEDLVPGKITNPLFKYQTPIIRFVNPLTPALDPALEINIAEFTPDAAGAPHTLETLLDNFFVAFFKGIGGSVIDETRTIKLGGSYRYYLQDAEERRVDLQATLPIFQTTPTPFQIDQSGVPAESNTFVTAVSDIVIGWAGEHWPSGIETDGRLFFDLSVFSSLSQTKLPVLRLRNLYLPSKQVIWEPPL